MNTSKRTTGLIAAALVAGVLIPAAPAAANLYAPVDDQPAATPANDSENIVLRRDGDRSTPFVAEAAREAPAAGDGFDWGDAAIGAGVGMLTVALVAGGAGTLSGRRQQRPSAPRAASQGA